MADKARSVIDKPVSSTPAPEIPRGGVWENQTLFGGKRLKDEFAAQEPFILWGLRYVGDVPVEQDGKTAPKTELSVSRIREPDEIIPVTTLSGPIAEMAKAVGERPELATSDFPVEAYWEQVPTSRALSEAVVLTAIRRWVDPASL